MTLWHPLFPRDATVEQCGCGWPQRSLSWTSVSHQAQYVLSYVKLVVSGRYIA